MFCAIVEARQRDCQLEKGDLSEMFNNQNTDGLIFKYRKQVGFYR